MKSKIELLKSAASLVSETQLYTNFAKDIEQLENHPSELSLCLILSTKPQGGLEDVLNAMTKMDSSFSDESMIEMVHQSDVLFWVMPALRMFHGDYSPALEAALKQSVPIWVGVTGLEAVSDPDAFVKSAITDAKTRLRSDSEIFFFRKDEQGSALERIRELLSIKSLMLSEQGKTRRFEYLLSSMLQRLTDLRRSTEADFSALEKRLDTASHGMESARIQIRSSSGQIYDLSSKLISLVDDWGQSMCGQIEEAGDSKKLESACKSIEKNLRDFLEETLQPNAGDAAVQLAAIGTSAWQDFRVNAVRFLNPVYRTNGDATVSSQEINFPDCPEPKIKHIADEYRVAVCEAANNLKNMFSADWWLSVLKALGAPVAKLRRNPGAIVAIESMRQRAERESAIAHLRAAVTRANQELRLIHSEYQNRLQELLDNETEAVSADLLNEANRKLDAPTALRQRILEASRLLESYGQRSK